MVPDGAEIRWDSGGAFAGIFGVLVPKKTPTTTTAGIDLCVRFHMITIVGGRTGRVDISISVAHMGLL